MCATEPALGRIETRLRRREWDARGDGADPKIFTAPAAPKVGNPKRASVFRCLRRKAAKFRGFPPYSSSIEGSRSDQSIISLNSTLLTPISDRDGPCKIIPVSSVHRRGRWCRSHKSATPSRGDNRRPTRSDATRILYKHSRPQKSLSGAYPCFTSEASAPNTVTHLTGSNGGFYAITTVLVAVDKRQPPSQLRHLDSTGASGPGKLFGEGVSTSSLLNS